MKTRRRMTCVGRTAQPGADCGISTAAWARDLVQHPDRYGATERERSLVLDLLLQLEAAA